MADLNRIRALLEVRQPRLKDFMEPYDKLNHGTVTETEFFRAMEEANISLTPSEILFVEQNYAKDGRINYISVIKDLSVPVADANFAAKHGSRAGVTAAFSGDFDEKYDDATEKIILELEDACRKRPVIGKSFFLDFDKLNDGIIIANQFARGLSLMYWAIFRRYPTQTEINKLIFRFWVDRLQHRELNDFEFDARINESREVDYRAFVAAVGAAGPGEGVPHVKVTEPRSDDSAFKEYANAIPASSPEIAFERVKVGQEKFRFDYKSFLQARDKRQLGFLELKEFIAGCVDAIPDFKRAGIDVEDFRQAAYLFIDDEAVEKANYTAEELSILTENPLDDDLQLINYRKFLKALLSIGDAMSVASGSERLEQLETLRRCTSDVTACPAMEKLSAYMHSHPCDLREEFERFDPRNTGRVTGQQFKQVIGKVVEVHSAATTQEDLEARRSARFTRDVVGLTFEELEEICSFYAVETISGIGDTTLCTASPDKLIGSGFLIDYITFVRDSNIEKDFIPNAQKISRALPTRRIAIPPVENVFWRIADSLGARHLKFSDCLNQGEMESTKWNRTVFGRISARKVHSALSNLLEIEISDAELCSIAMACPADEGIEMKQFIADKCEECDDVLVLPPEITDELLRTYLDKSEISAKLLEDRLKQITDVWRPARATGVSQKEQNEIIQPVVTAEPNRERDGMDVTMRSVKHLHDLTDGKEFADLVLDEKICVKGEPILIGDLYESVKHPEHSRTLLEHSAAMILAVYLELHIRAANMAPEFREFDKLKLGVVTSDEFARAFVLANMGGLINKYPKAFSSFTQLYTHTQAGKFLGMVDYALMLRELGVPPPNSVFVSMEDEELVVQRSKRLADYRSVEEEAEKNLEESMFHASLEGVEQDLAKFCYEYKPKFRDYFLDFDKARRGVCESSKLGAALSEFKCLVSQEEETQLLANYRSVRFGFEGCFEWKKFVEDLEAVVGFRL